MKRLRAPDIYDATNETSFRQIVRDADDENHKRNTDIEVGRGHLVILTDTVTGHRYSLTMVSGTLTATMIS